jgi:hypothetical protein
MLGRLLALGLLLAGCGRSAPPEEVALAYGRAVYASDADAMWRLISGGGKAWRGSDCPDSRRLS